MSNADVFLDEICIFYVFLAFCYKKIPIFATAKRNRNQSHSLKPVLSRKMLSKKVIPPYLQRGIGALIILLMGISVARLLTRVHQLEERIDQLEESQVALHGKQNRMDDALHQLNYGETHRSYQSSTRSSYSPHNKPERRNFRQEDWPEILPQDSSAIAMSSTPPSYPQETKRSNKYTEPRRFNLNNIDSVTLVRIPGIAARTASTILRYRERYGGFYDPWQLQDFMTWEAAEAHMEEWCTEWFSAELADIRHIRINQATVAELCRHPYITYEQAIELVKYRTRHKKIEKLEEINNFSTFKPEEIKRLAPYLSFE